MNLPLSNIRVLDVSQVMAGPFCCMLLGDMGADVVKIEPPGVGDQTRAAMGFRLKGSDSGGILALNRNKRSRSDEHTSELQSLMRISYAVFCLKKKKKSKNT